MEWTGQVYADTPVVAAQIYIEAPPERVWRHGERHLPDAGAERRAAGGGLAGRGQTVGPAVGHRFTGRNAHPAMGEWETVSTVVACDPPRCFAWAVGDPGHPSATWRFTLRPDGTGTLLEQWYQMGPARSGLNIAIDAMPDKEQKIVFVRLREHETGMKHNLEAIKERAER